MSENLPNKLPISVVFITKNAAKTLADALTCASFVDEIIVMDSGSTDETREIAEQAGARFLAESWAGFGLQKQKAVNAAKHDWVLCLDADEYVSEALQRSIRKAFERQDFYVYKMPRCNRFLGKNLYHGEAYPDYNTRFFHKDYAAWSEDVVHEHVLVKEKTTAIGVLTGDLMHDSAETIASYLEKQNRYTSLAAEAAIKKGKRANVVSLVLSPLFRFFKFYVVRRGFLDGAPGFIHILMGCFNSFLKYAKMLEIARKKSDDKNIKIS